MPRNRVERLTLGSIEFPIGSTEGCGLAVPAEVPTVLFASPVPVDEGAEVWDEMSKPARLPPGSEKGGGAGLEERRGTGGDEGLAMMADTSVVTLEEALERPVPDALGLGRLDGVISICVRVPGATVGGKGKEEMGGEGGRTGLDMFPLGGYEVAPVDRKLGPAVPVGKLNE